MMLEFLPEAAQEAADVTAHYEEAEPGLGQLFRRELQSATAAILLYPLLWRQRRGGYRRVNLPGFPFYVASAPRRNRVRVVAIGHGARQPGYFGGSLRQPPIA